METKDIIILEEKIKHFKLLQVDEERLRLVLSQLQGISGNCGEVKECTITIQPRTKEALVLAGSRITDHQVRLAFEPIVKEKLDAILKQMREL